ncbi:MAG TPA: MBL fold metallo-hydrolase [Puia sp.]|nr:MBL fold metallo-hydrolase [Puia sp.]
MKIIPLSEGAFTVDKSKRFVPFNTATDNLQQRAAGSLLVEVQPFVIVTSKDVLLLDTGLGFEENGVLQLHNNLIAGGIQPSSVTKILMSHLHKDHSGGMVQKNPSNNSYEISFPNATYYLQKKELDYAFEKGFPSYITDELEILRTSPNIILLDGDGILDNYIRYEMTGAHCPYHQVFWIEENNEKIFFGGDVAPQLQQMKSRFIAKYDYDGKKCMELRKQWWQQGEKEKWTFLFYHDIRTPIYTN